MLDPREKARRDKERELNADLNNAADLFGAAALGGTARSLLYSLLWHTSNNDLCILRRHFVFRARLPHFRATSNEGGLYQTLWKHHRVHYQATSEQAAVRHVC